MQCPRFLVLVTFAIGCSGTNAGSDGGSGDDAPPMDDGGVVGDGAPADGEVTIDSGMISNCPNGTWCREDVPAGVTALIHSVDAADENHVFAVGDGGTILVRTNGAWTRMTSATTKNLRGVWAASANDAWAAGQDGTVLHWDGTAWSAVTGGPPTIDYAAVWGANATDVWFVGTGTAVHWNGTALSNPGAVITGTPVSISGVTSNDIWIASESGRVSHYTTSWGLVTPMVNGSSPGTSYFAVGARAANDVWASLPGTGTIRWNGATWTAHATGTVLFASIHAPGATNAWGAGGTKVGHWDGASWTIATPVAGLTAALFGISGIGPHTWAVGDAGTILYRHD